MQTRRFKFKLTTIIIFFVCLVVLVSLMITDFLISSTVSKNIRKHQEEKALMNASHKAVREVMDVLDKLG